MATMTDEEIRNTRKEDYAKADPFDNDPWPEIDRTILNVERADPPALNLAVFGHYWAQWIQDQAEAKSCAPDYVAAGLMSGAGALLGMSRGASPWDGWIEPPGAWIAAVGAPSSGKSPGLEVIRDILGMIEAELNEEHESKILAWDTAKRLAKIRMEVWEADCKAKRRDGKPEPERPNDAEDPARPQRRRIVTCDATTEKLARLAKENSRGLHLFRDELAGWIGNLDKYGGAGGDRAFFLEAHGGRSYVVDRVKDPEPLFVPSLAIWILGGIQPDRLASQVLSGDDDGLAARFLYVWPAKTPPRRPTRPIPTGAKAKLFKLYRVKPRDDGERIILRLDPDAADLVQKWRVEVAGREDDASGLYLSWLGKLPGLAVRLALILEHLKWCGDNEESQDPPGSVSKWATAAAVAFLGGYALPMARRCFGEAVLPQAEKDARTLARWLLKNEDACADSANSANRSANGTNGTNGTKTFSVNARSLRRACVLDAKDPGRYEAALRELEAAGWVRPASSREGRHGGRQRKDWAVNPLVWEGGK